MPAKRRQYIFAWVAGGEQPQALTSIKRNGKLLSGINTFWYYLDPSGALQKTRSDKNITSATRRKNIQLIAVISNEFDPARTSLLLTNADLKQRFFTDVVKSVRKNKYDGIELDFENLRAEDRDLFTGFVAELKSNLAPTGAVLTIDVLPKTSEPGMWSGPQAHDYAGLAKAADQLNIMAYDEHYSLGEPGPVASIGWVKKVLHFSLTKIPPKKLVLGVPLYGYDWSGTGKAEAIGYPEAIARAKRFDAPIHWNAKAGAPWYTYDSDGQHHEVWFSNARSVIAVLDTSEAAGIKGFGLFRLGLEDPKVWTKIDRRIEVQK